MVSPGSIVSRAPRGFRVPFGILIGCLPVALEQRITQGSTGWIPAQGMQVAVHLVHGNQAINVNEAQAMQEVFAVVQLAVQTLHASRYSKF